MHRITKHYLIEGAVQGVGFRAFAERNARRHKLRGWVRNLNDGRVEVFVNGGAESLREFEDQLRQGPRHGRVDRIDAQELESGEVTGGFSILDDAIQADFGKQ